MRVSFVGGGSDYESFFAKDYGSILGCTIDLNVYITAIALPTFLEEKLRFTYRQTENVEEYDQIKHPVVREVLKYLKWNIPINLATFADVPGGSGLGGSSAFTVGLLSLLNSFRNIQITPTQLADSAIHIERTILAESGGIQDQLHAAFGGLRKYSFHGREKCISEPILTDPELQKLGDYFTLVAVGEARSSALLANNINIVAQTKKRDLLQELSMHSEELYKKIQNEKSIRNIAFSIGDSINAGWEIKMSLDKEGIAPLAIDQLITRGLLSGANAAKLCGAGGSGFVLFQHDEHMRENLVKEFGNRIVMPVEFVNHGNQIYKTN